jgi:hypothetical protein
MFHIRGITTCPYSPIIVKLRVELHSQTAFCQPLSGVNCKKRNEFQFYVTSVGCTRGNTFETKIYGMEERKDDYRKALIIQWTNKQIPRT